MFCSLRVINLIPVYFPGKQFAGIRDEHDCFCLDENDIAKGHESGCIRFCARTQPCGGVAMMSVYSVGE